jgi:hypothetical protein
MNCLRSGQQFLRQTSLDLGTKALVMVAIPAHQLKIRVVVDIKTQVVIPVMQH